MGDIAMVRSQVVAAHDTSVVVGLDVLKEDPMGETKQALTANFVYVSPVGDAGLRPKVPKLTPTTEAEADWQTHAAAYRAKHKKQQASAFFHSSRKYLRDM